MRTFTVRYPEPEVIHGLDGEDGIDGIGEKGARGERGEKGDRGDPGFPGTPGTPGAGLRWRGEWEHSQSYQRYDLVHFARSSFICIKDHVANRDNEPLGSDLDPFWDIFAKSGLSGFRGQGGEKGEQGPSGKTYYVQDTEPAGAVTDDIWVNTTPAPPRTYIKS